MSHIHPQPIVSIYKIRPDLPFLVNHPFFIQLRLGRFFRRQFLSQVPLFLRHRRWRQPGQHLSVRELHGRGGERGQDKVRWMRSKQQHEHANAGRRTVNIEPEFATTFVRRANIKLAANPKPANIRICNYNTSGDNNSN